MVVLVSGTLAAPNAALSGASLFILGSRKGEARQPGGLRAAKMLMSLPQDLGLDQQELGIQPPKVVEFSIF